VAASLLGCRVASPPSPAADEFSWSTYRNGAVGYAVEFPDVYTIDEEAGGKAVFFRWQGRIPVKIYLADEATGRKRGLWTKHEPVGEAALGGRSARLYEYLHCDGPFCSRMRAYVVEHGDRQLGLEFRSAGELNAVNRHILESFTFVESDGQARGGRPGLAQPGR
jgi:hypothetical protein